MLFVVISASAAFAADTNLTTDNNGIADNTLASVDEDSSLSASEANGDVLGDTEITPDNIKNYVDEKGVLNCSDDTITFKGEFNGNESFKMITVNSSVTLNGANATFNNIGFQIIKDGVIINGLKLIESINPVAINVQNAKNVKINEVTINFTSVDGYDNAAIVFINSDEFELIQNTINYVGSTTYNFSNTKYSYGIVISNSTKGKVSKNTFNISSTSCAVFWDEQPPGSWNYVRCAFSGGIRIEVSNNLTFEENGLYFKYNNYSGSGDTVYVLDIAESNNTNIIHNNIIAEGHYYIYGIIITGDNFNISGNNITVSSPVYANGIDVEGPATGTIEGNKFSIVSNSTAYPIYSGMNYKPVTVDIIDNEIIAYSFFACGLELGGTFANVKNNTIGLLGNYTIGIGSSVSNLVAYGNMIFSLGSGVGNASSIWDGIGAEIAGIKVISGNADIADNHIIASKALSLKGNIITVLNNTLGSTRNYEDAFNYNLSDSANLYCVYIDSVSNLTFKYNEVIFVGSTDRYAYDYAVFINNAPNAIIENNTFNLTLVSCKVDWFEIPPGSGNWVKSPVSLGIFIASSDGISFIKNHVIVTPTNVTVGDSDTIYSVEIDSDDALIANNVIDATGKSYIYGLLVNGKNLNISNNNITAKGESYANGIDVEGPASGVIENNNIMAKADANGSAYPIYTAMTNGEVSLDIKNNNISGEAYFVCGIETAGDIIDIENNVISATGNYTLGIGSVANKLIATNNTIIAQGSNVGNLSIWDGIGVETAGIKSIAGNVVLNDNNVTSTGKNITVSNVVGTIITGDIKKAYNANYNFQAQFVGLDGKALANITVTFNVNGKTITKTTDANGYVTLTKAEIASTVGTYSITSKNPVTNETLTNTVKLVNRLTGNKNINMYYYDGTSYKVRAFDDDGNPVGAGQVVAIKVGSKTYKVKTDKNGYATLKLTELPKSKAYTITATYKGQTVKNTLKVKQVLSAKSAKVKKSAKKLVLKATLKQGKKPIKGKKVVFKFKGKNYAAKTNKKGIAQVTIKKSVIKKLKAGKKYPVKVSYIKDAVKASVIVKK